MRVAAHSDNTGAECGNSKMLGSLIKIQTSLLYGSHLLHNAQVCAKQHSSSVFGERPSLIITWPLGAKLPLHEKKGKLQGEGKTEAQCQK